MKKASLLKSMLILTSCSLLACQTLPSENEDAVLASPITTTTSDDVDVFGEVYFGDLSNDAPLVLLFHQGGSNGRAEYVPIAGWLNDNGFRAIAWDQRSGGTTYGYENRTKNNLPNNASTSFCDAASDLQAALDYVIKNNIADNVTLWGSSYSAALVFQLAKQNPEHVNGVISFSPASGGPLIDCRARLWASQIDAPRLVLRPSSEMARDSSKEQKNLLTQAGVEFRIVEGGIHGSSMLVDERTEKDMTEARLFVTKWLKGLAR